MNVLLVGSGAREHAIALALKKSTHSLDLFCFGSSNNPGIRPLTAGYAIGNLTHTSAIVEFAKKNAVDWAIIGPETPLSVGVVDELAATNILSVGPTKAHAQTETSKTFTRDLFRDYTIAGSARYKPFSSMDGVEDYTKELDDQYVVKADGLAGGKGVKVYGEHLHSFEDTRLFCEEILSHGGNFLIEEKFVGQEFSLMSFSDGEHLAHMPAVQDHKRAFINDAGPNTGGMGSYSDANHSLPFLAPDDILAAQKINESAIRALKQKLGTGYKGILYGGFMATKSGVKIIEYNARFGDPESINVLAVLESDFVELCQAIIAGNLTQRHARFLPIATVCKYAVPNGYPNSPLKNEVIDISEVHNKCCLRYASVDERGGELFETGSRTVAVVATAGTIAEAEKIAEAEVLRIKGPLFHREDIGTQNLIQQKVLMMQKLRV